MTIGLHIINIMTTGLQRTGLERVGFERAAFENAAFENAQVLRFPAATDTRTTRRRPRRWSLRARFAVRRSPRRAVAHRPMAAVGAATTPVRRARATCTTPRSRAGIAPPF